MQKSSVRNIPSNEVKKEVKALLREWKNIKEEVGILKMIYP